MSKLILVVDDDTDFLDQFELKLESLGYQVRTAAGYAPAQEALQQARPDLAIVDLMMEEQDAGFRLCFELKQRFPRMPVILVSGVTGATGLEFDAATDEERSWIKADAFLDKPIRFEQLQREIQRLLQTT